MSLVFIHRHQPRKAKKPAPEVTLHTVNTHLSLVREGGVVLGFIEKYPDTLEEQHPYKAFKAIVGQGPVRVDSSNMTPFWTLNAAIAHLKQFKGVC